MEYTTIWIYLYTYSFSREGGGVGREHVHMCMQRRGIEEEYRVPPKGSWLLVVPQVGLRCKILCSV